MLRTSLLALLQLASLTTQPALAASTVSDLLIVFDPDGRRYTAQHLLTTDGVHVSLTLPADRTTLATRFAGPERLTFAHAHELTPNRLSLWSGSVLTRYRYRYATGLTQPEPGIHELETANEHAAVMIENTDSVQWSVTWILPARATLLDFEHQPAAQPADSALQTRARSDAAAAGRWQTSANVLTFQQSGGLLAELRIRFALDNTLATGSDPCVAALNATDACSPDIDGDEVPDYRDVCLPLAEGEQALLASAALSNAASSDTVSRGTSVSHGVAANARLSDFTADETAARSSPEKISRPVVADSLGCDHQSLIILSGIRFQSGQSYLDVASREVLDRVARALQRVPDALFEIGSHTDNAGRVAHNQRLSENRADAVRHYLMLRGIDPNQVRSRGYGETSPAYDNAQAAGRRANRRTVLQRLN